ncbi:MaoC family dehydratase [Paenibacillus solani]|uniref:MaoC family dehydratase n=1 Tax=Paenibacillus solani TaxID=1705565 RepID=UPI003D2D5FDD
MKRRITAEAIRQYAYVSKDDSAIHLNAEAAANSGFKRPIVHGMYMMGLAQSLYISEHPQQWITAYALKFINPLYVDSDVVFDFTETNGDICVTVTGEDGELIASGTLTLKEGLL